MLDYLNRAAARIEPTMFGVQSTLVETASVDSQKASRIEANKSRTIMKDCHSFGETMGGENCGNRGSKYFLSHGMKVTCGRQVCSILDKEIQEVGQSDVCQIVQARFELKNFHLCLSIISRDVFPESIQKIHRPCVA